MKLCLLLAVGAFATQDVTPPVISLSLAGHPYTHTGWNNNQGTNSASRACIVGSDATDAQCLLTYKAHDNSGNCADEIVFSFLFLDPFVPNLTGFTAEAGVGYNQDINGWAHGYA